MEDLLELREYAMLVARVRPVRVVTKAFLDERYLNVQLLEELPDLRVRKVLIEVIIGITSRVSEARTGVRSSGVRMAHLVEQELRARFCELPLFCRR